MLGREKIKIGLADSLGRVAEIEPVRHRAVDAHKAALPVLEINMIGDGIEERFAQETFLGLDRLAPRQFVSLTRHDCRLDTISGVLLQCRRLVAFQGPPPPAWREPNRVISIPTRQTSSA